MGKTLHRFEVVQKRNGDCLVPLNYSKYPKLGIWVKEQRRHYALIKQKLPSHMTEERAASLNAISFCWDTYEGNWVKRFRDLCQYKAQFGDCIVPLNFSANLKLGTWVRHQRRQYKKYKEGGHAISLRSASEHSKALALCGIRRRNFDTRTINLLLLKTESDSNDEEKESHYRNKERCRLVQS